MLYALLSLGLASASPALPTASITSGAAIATCFSPEENCNAFAVDAADGADREILVSAYSLTTGSGILEALVRATHRGVDVRLIADKTTPCERESGVGALAGAGASVWIDVGVRIAHAKSMVIDGKVTLVGSMNWSAGAARNSEDLNLIASSEVAAAYAAHWRQRLAASVPFAGRDGGADRALREILCERLETPLVSRGRSRRLLGDAHKATRPRCGLWPRARDGG